ncbi:hypothetical protein [Saccharopolyspora sp. ASAGF58]|uniref:hypothetical protein n=1 Tax=Saccharopolyspora sp. ASAGF58 TaxID=2719023 RepID=UPI00143FEA7C|nr:hypothetical protein [Saccharopolyspora sp. ASAGF58]QIZ34916.1 hypothetical protein FDZ84_09500 [Saccharopolyspora sp. ASAGF58]
MTDLEQQVDAFGRPVPEPAPTPPQALLVARWLWIGSVLIGVVQAFIQLLDRPQLIDKLRQLQPDMSQLDLEAAANSGIMFTFLLKAMILLLYVMLSRRMLEGRNWARIVLTVFGGFGIINALITVLTVSLVGSALIRQLTGVAVNGVDVVFSLVVMLVEIAAIVFMYRPDSNRFCQAMRNRRPGNAPTPTGNRWS